MKFFNLLSVLQSNEEKPFVSEKTATTTPTKDLASISSQIFLLKKKLANCVEDFVEGFNVWEKSKAQIILAMAETLERLHELGEYSDGLDTISTHIRQMLAEREVSPGQLDYISDVLPSKYKNANLARDTSAWKSKPPAGAEAAKESLALHLDPKNVYTHQKELEGMTVTEFIDQCLKEEQEERHIRNIIKARKENREFVAIKTDRPLPRYKKVSAEVPPEHLQGPSLLFDAVKELSNDFLEIHRYLEDIAQSIYQFPPTKSTAEKNATQIWVFRNGVMKGIKMMLLPYTDKKWSGDWVRWIDIQLTRLEQSKNYAGTKHKMGTGEYAVKLDKEGNEVIFELDRGITREQVGDITPSMYKMVKQMLLSIPMINAFNDWSYNTSIMEEYDADGNPIIHDRDDDEVQE